MAVGDFTKEEADKVTDCIVAMHNALSKAKRFEYIGELNEALCFVGAAKRHAPPTTAQNE